MKYVKRILMALVVIIGLVVYFNFEKLDIVSGYSAKSMASSVYVGERPFLFTDTTDNNFSPINIAKDVVHASDQSASASVFGLNTRTAVYRDGLGTVLLPHDYDYQGNAVQPKRVQTTIDAPYPFGHLPAKDTLLAEVNYKGLEGVLDTYFAPERQTRAVLVLYKDQIIAERYADGFDKDSRLLGWSMTKSITSTMYGILSTNGVLDVQQPAPIEAWQQDARKEITLNNLLQMNSGLEWVEDYETISDVTKMLFQEVDMAESQLDKPLVGSPNAQWYYSSGTTNLLSGILRGYFKDHQSYLDGWYSLLIDKIGMHSMLVEADLAGNYVGSSYGWATPRDWAKFGTLYLHKGQWNGTRIFSEAWFNYAIRPTPTSEGRYGAQIWLNKGGFLPDVPRDVFSFNGYQGQRVYICPSQDLVVVRMGLKSMDFNVFLTDIMAQIK